MRHRRFTACVFLTVLLAGFCSLAAQQQEGPTRAQAEEQVRQIRAALKNPAAPPETWGMLMMAETVLLNVRAQQGELDEAALGAEQRALVKRIMAEWKAARPDDPTPYLAEIQGAVPPERADDAVLDLLPRFPDSPRLLSRVLQILTRREQTPRATELIEEALDRHPERSELYSVAIGFYRGLSNETRQQELIAAWIERQPGNPDALRSFLGQFSPARDPRESADRVERFVAAGGADPGRANVCEWLLTVDKGAYRDAAVRCLSAILEQTKDEQLRARISGQLAGAGGVGGGGGVGGNEQEQCERKMDLLKTLPEPGSPPGPDFFGALSGCQTFPPARAAYLDALARAPAGDLNDLLQRWFINVNGRSLDESGLGPRAVPVLEDRLRRESGEIEVWRALAKAYAIAGWDERRAAHLTAWSGKDLAPPSGADLIWLGRFRAGHDSPQAGIDALRGAWRRTHDTDVAAALADLLLAARQMDGFAALVNELALDDAAVANSTGGHLARLLRARGTLLRQGAEAALPEYQAYVDRAPYLKPAEAAEYLLVLGGLRGGPAAEQAAQTLCAKESMRSTSTPAQCAAGLLAQLGHEEGALELLAAAAERAPEDIGLQSSFAWSAEQAGAFDRAEQAYKRILAADPKSEAAWSGLGRIAEKRGDPAELEALLRQAERARGEQPAALVLALARSCLAHGKASRAIEVLTALRERLPGSFVGEDELRQAYEALAEERPAARAASAVATAAPSAGDLQAAREIEAFLLGLGRPVDEAKGRELVKSLAAQGNLYATIRLAVWQQAGTQGFEANPRQAAATVAPSLPALRAAAEAGEPFAQYLWGTVLLRGLGVNKQAVEAGAWLHKAAEKGEPWALHNLGWMAEQGEGVSRDLGEALRWYRRGAEAGNPFSMMSLATLRLGTEPGVRDPADGLLWLGRAAEKGLPKAVTFYAQLLVYGVRPDVPPDPVKARPWLEKAAALGEVTARYDLGRELLLGTGGPMDERRGVALLEQAAEGGNAQAMWQLVWQTALGRGTAHDPVRAEQWIERAAALGFDQPDYIAGTSEEEGEPARRHFAEGLRAMERLASSGDAFAGGLLARLYSMGLGVELDPARALALAQRAAAGGSTEAMRVLGWAYRKGDGVEADAAQAAAWYRRGAEGGNTFCMMWYSQMLFRGQGGTKDSVAALAWLERSGERGNAWAIRDLGHLYDEGWYDLPRDETKAAAWKRKALASGDQEARGWLLAHHLSE